MKVYTEYGKESDSAEILITYQELKKLLKGLSQFEQEIGEYMSENKDKDNLGFTHLHFVDLIDNKSSETADLVFYVDMDKEE